MKTLSAAKAVQIMIDSMGNDSYRVMVESDATFIDRLYRLNPKFAAGFIYKKMNPLLGQ